MKYCKHCIHFNPKTIKLRDEYGAPVATYDGECRYNPPSHDPDNRWPLVYQEDYCALHFPGEVKS